MLASASWLMAFSTLCLMPSFLRSFETRSDFSTDVVPTSTGWPRSWQSLISSTTPCTQQSLHVSIRGAASFSRSVL